jgi:small multidrug resistance pump
MRPGFSAPWWVLLLGAVASEVSGTLALRLSDGLTRAWPTVAVLALYAVATVLFARVLERDVGLGVAYGTFTACGLLAATGLSAVAFGEPLSWVQLAGVAVLLGGILALQLPARPG